MAAATGVAAVTLWAHPAAAADEINIDHVESTDGNVSVLVAVDGLPAGVTPDVGGVTVSVDGEAVTAEAKAIEAGEIERTTILTIDASNSMNGDRIAAAKAAAHAFLESAPPDVRIGLLTFSGTVQDTIAPTTDHESIAAAVDTITLDKGTRVYDAMVQSVNLAGTDGARSLLVLSDGADTGSEAAVQDTVDAATDARVIVDVVSLDQSPKHEAVLTEISSASGGKVIAADASALSEVFKAQADALASQLLVTFPAPQTVGEEASLDVTLTAGDTTYSDSAFVSLGSAAEAPRSVDLGEPLVNRGAMLLGAVALALGLAGVLAVVLLGNRGPSDSERRISAYFGQSTGGKRSKEMPAHQGLVDSAVHMTAKVVKGDFESRVATKLAGAGSALTPAEWLLIHAGVAVGMGFVGFVFRGGALAVFLTILGVLAPWVYLKFRHSKRLAAFNAQLAETLTLMAGGLSAGLSLPQAVDTVVREGQEPMASELRRVLVEQRLGVDIEDALDGVSHRMESQDFGWVVMAIRIQREVGGNLAELLTTVADTIREREYLRRQVKVLSAEGRISAWVLGALPIVMFLYMLMVRPDFVRPLYTEPMGLVLGAAAVGLICAGFFIMSRLVRIEV
ncbi:type II secretion system F family protein [Nocardioides gansuensis]|uniref:type II secretion system F family protein n=1 Tax=Nocardioides gansuensis TaxID=2138300 RepID=UPI00140204AC|nr:type II secretion system F family protein [Nocardioides gansuensis]